MIRKRSKSHLRKPRKRKHKRTSSEKVKLIDSIRSLRLGAAHFRLTGRIRNATVIEDLLEKKFAEAERRGWSEQATNADEAALRAAQRIERRRRKRK
jgi:hypothetical protein